MPYRQDLDTGEWIEVDAQGNPVADAPQGQVFTLPESPKQIAERARQNAKDERDAADKAADNARADETLDLRRELAELDAELKRAQLNKAQGGTNTADGRTRVSRLNQLTRQINRVQTLYDNSIGKTKDLAGVQDYLPLDANKRFDAAGAALSQQGLAAFRVPGTGTVSDRDAMMFDRANLPTAATRDAAIEEQLLGLRARVEEEMDALGQDAPKWVNGQQAEDEIAAAESVEDPSPDALPPVGQGGNDPMGPIASGNSRTESDPRVNSMINSLVNAGAGKPTIDAALKERGLPAISPGEWARVKAWQRDNPGVRYEGANVTREVPLSLLEKAAGSTFGSGVAHYTNMAAAGIPAALAGERGKGALDAMEAANPRSAMTGKIFGGITGALGAEAALGAKLAGTGFAKFAPRIADTGFGATLGFNEAEEGQGLQGAALGGATGLVGGVIGEKALKGVGRTMQGVTDPLVQSLRARGVPLTFGQAVSQSGRIGEGIKKTEDALTTVPFVGNMVDARRMEGIEDWNRAVFQEAAPPGAQITAVGPEGVQQLQQAKTSAYRDALEGAIIDITGDQAALDDITNASLMAQNIPQVGDKAADAIEYRVGGGMDFTGRMDGRDFQEAYRGLGRDGRSAANGEYGHEFGQTTRMAQDALGEALERQNPGAFDGFVEANAANRRLNVVSDAVTRAVNQGDNLVTPAQLNRADTTSTSRLEGKINSAAGNRPFQDIATAGQAVLPSKLPDSGTWTRAIVGGSLTGGAGAGGYAMGGGEGAATGTASGATLAALLALGGTKAGQRALTSAVLDRPEAILRAGELLARNSQIGGGFGSGILTPLLVSPQ